MIKGEYEQLDDLAKNHICTEHPDKALTVAWDREGFYYLKCGAGHAAKAITKVLTLTEEHRAGLLPDGPVKDNVEKSIRRRAEKLPSAPEAETFSGIPAADLGTGELIPIDKIRGLVVYAQRYGLDPTRGHVVLMYGDPYITIDGYLYHANRSGVPYSLTSRPLEEAERKAYQLQEGDHAWISTVEIPSQGVKFTAPGIVTRREVEEEAKGKPGQKRSPVVAAHPWQLAQKRADWQVLRRAFPIGEATEE